MAGPAHPIRLNPAVGWTPGGIQTIPLTLGADVDLTVPTASGGQTNGYCARFIQNGGTAGNLVFYDLVGTTQYTVALGANQFLSQGVSYVVNSGTTCDPSAVL
jgi:hypothetical protein